MSASVTLLDDDSLTAFMSVRQPRVILFTAKHSVPSMFSSAAAAHARDAVFGRVHSSSTAIMLRFGVDPAQVPRLIVVTLERTYLFKGEASAEAITHFIGQVLQHVRSSAAPASSPSPLPSSAGRASAVSWFWFRCTPRCCFRATRLTSHVSRHSLARASDRVQLVSVRRPSLPPSSSMPRSLAHCTPWSAVDSRGVAPWVAPPAITSIADASRYFHQLQQLNAMTSLGPFVNDIISPLVDDRSHIFCDV